MWRMAAPDACTAVTGIDLGLRQLRDLLQGQFWIQVRSCLYRDQVRNMYSCPGPVKYLRQ
jgi:hypothetical protein